ncbi:hypothetical protein SLS60_007532 [Paraconiothyrium brasiliense]|uniref:Uncharacterized protein n=1 Tax=Paraconiothyrium brasiliense TaxID=300254 RepID=A0ABR3R6I1_9PLEO
MAVDASKARLTFLRQAAYQLTTTAPAVAANLSSNYIHSVIGAEDDLQHAKKEWDTLRREACVQALQSKPSKHVSSNSTRKALEAVKPLDSDKPIGEGQDKVTKSANATSKQRKKSRKGGLQAMLEKNKSQSSGSGLGLDLMDFMQ